MAVRWYAHTALPALFCERWLGCWGCLRSTNALPSQLSLQTLLDAGLKCDTTAAWL